MPTLRQTPITCSGHTRPVVQLAFSKITPFGYFLISASKDSLPMLRQGDTGDWVGTFTGHKGAVWAATLNDDGTLAATGSADYTAKVWDGVTGEVLHSFEAGHVAKSVAFSNDNAKLLTGTLKGLIQIHNLQAPEKEPIQLTGHSSGIKHALFANNGKLVISSADDGTVRIWDMASNKEVRKTEFDNTVSDLEISADEKLVTLTYGNTVEVRDSTNFTLKKTFVVPCRIYTASMHPDKEVLVCGGEDFIIYKLRCDTGEQVDAFKGHFGPVHCIRYSPDGELSASCSEDGTLRLWQNVVGKTYGLWKSPTAIETLPE